MTFQALARTWRPRRFDELVGQSHVVRALTHALEQNKLHHALLFSGTRGVGKTTLARIIAKCLNCEHGTSAQPCRGDNACATCREIDDGRFIDLIEVDAASRTGVDDTRELMDNVQYAPTRGRTKVYLIDEVHMLSKHSFNALLKTLEEPPPRVQFLLATTEPEKIPVTILSRCLQFPLKRLPVAEITAQLRHIVDAESVEADDQALTEVARAADGSMRDGLSLLDQAIAFSGGRLKAEPVRDMLGTIGEARVAELVDAIVDGHAASALDALAGLYAQGIDMRYLLEALATAWQQIAIIHVIGEAIDEVGEAWQAVAARADPAATQLYYDIAVAGLRDLAYAPDPLVGVKMSVLRMLAFAPADEPEKPSSETPPNPAPAPENPPSGIAQVRAQLQGSDSKPHRARAETERAEAAPSTATSAPQEPRVEEPAAVVSSPDDGPDKPASPAASAPTQTLKANADTADVALPEQESATPVPAQPAVEDSAQQTPASEPTQPTKTPADGVDDWHDLVSRLDLGGFAAQLAHNGVCHRLDAQQIVLVLARANEMLATANAREALQAAFLREWAPGTPPRLVIEYVDETRDTPAQRIAEDAQSRQRDAVASIENDPFVQQLRDRLGAQLRAETIKPYRPQSATQPRDEP